MRKETDKKSVVLDFSEKAIRKVAFTNSKEEAYRLKNELNMQIYFPSELANFETESAIFVLLDSEDRSDYQIYPMTDKPINEAEGN